MGLSHSPKIVTDGLVLCLDIAKSTNDNAGQGWGTDYFNGSIYKLAVYSRVLTASEIQQNFKQQEVDMEFETRQYVIFNVSELDKIDFDQVMETSAETVRRSVDGTLTFVKWDGDVPACVETLTTKGEYMTHSEILAEMATETWTAPMTEEM